MTTAQKSAPPINFNLPKWLKDNTGDAVSGVRLLLDKFGMQVEPALYALLCDTQHPLRTTVDKNLKEGTQSAMVVLVPLLIAQFALAPAVAAVVAGFAVKVIAEKGQTKLCAELAERRRQRKGFLMKRVETPKAKRAGGGGAVSKKTTRSKSKTQKKSR